MVKEFPLFKNLNDSIIHQLVQRSKTRYFNRGDTILLEGKFNGDLYFIVRGSVALRKWFDIENLLPGNAASRRRDTLFSLAGSSIKSKNDNTPSSNQTINSVHTVFSVGIASADSTAATTAAFPRFSSVGNSNHRQSLASSTSTPSAALPRFASSGSSHQQPMDFSTIKKNNEKVLDDDAASLASLDGVVIELASLVEGGIFPELVLPQDLAPKSMAYCIRNDPLSARAAKGDVNGVLSGELRRHFIESGDEYASYQTVVCEQAVTCIVISRSEFLRIAPPGLVRELFDKNTDVCCADSDDVRLQYQMMREWNQYKRQVISDAHQDKKFESQRSLKHC